MELGHRIGAPATPDLDDDDDHDRTASDEHDAPAPALAVALRPTRGLRGHRSARLGRSIADIGRRSTRRIRTLRAGFGRDRPTHEHHGGGRIVVDDVGGSDRGERR